MPYFTYILQSLQDNSYYIGYTKNLESRLQKHNTSKSGYTSTKKPWKVVYYEMFDNKTTAIKREKLLKKMKSREFISKLIDNPG